MHSELGEHCRVPEAKASKSPQKSKASYVEKVTSITDLCLAFGGNSNSHVTSAVATAGLACVSHCYWAIFSFFALTPFSVLLNIMTMACPQVDIFQLLLLLLLFRKTHKAVLSS